MEIDSKGNEYYEVFICDKVVVSRENAINNFREYLHKKLEEFTYEMTRKRYPAMPPTTNHIIVPD